MDSRGPSPVVIRNRIGPPSCFCAHRSRSWWHARYRGFVYSAYIVELSGLVGNNSGDRRTLAFVGTTTGEVRGFLEQLVTAAVSPADGAIDLLEELRMSLETDAADEEADDDEQFHARLYVVQSGELVSAEILDGAISMKVKKKVIPLNRRKRVAREADAIRDEATTFAFDWPSVQAKLVELVAPTLPQGEVLAFEPADDYEGESYADDVSDLKLGMNWGDV